MDQRLTVKREHIAVAEISPYPWRHMPRIRAKRKRIYRAPTAVAALGHQRLELRAFNRLHFQQGLGQGCQLVLLFDEDVFRSLVSDIKNAAAQSQG